MRFLVTGGCGFIGSHLVRLLQDDGHQVRVLDDLSSGRRDNVAPQTELVVGSVTNEAAVQAAIAGVDGCFHLAAIASVERSHAAWCASHRVNLGGTINVLQAAHTAARGHCPPVVYASSAAVYGDVGTLPLREADQSRPTSAYGADKQGCELHARVASHVLGVPTVGLRFFNVYGPRQDPRSPYTGVISKFAAALYRGLPLDIHGDGKQTRDFVYVEDVTRFLVAAMERAGRVAPAVFNVCSGHATSIRHLAATMGALLGKPPQLRPSPPRPGDVRASVGSPLKALYGLEREAVIGLEQGLQRTLDWIATDGLEPDQPAAARPRIPSGHTVANATPSIVALR